MFNSLLFRIVIAMGTLLGTAFAAPPRVPVQGVLTDEAGAAIDGPLEVRFTLYADAAGDQPIWTETRPVDFVGGFFTTYLGAGQPLDLTLFRDHPAVWLGVAVDGDAEMPLIELGTAPYAAFAAHAGEADRVGGLSPEDLAPAVHRHDWAQLDGVPPELADGDDDTTYNARPGGGLALADGAFGLTACADGEVLKQRGGAWVCDLDSVGDADSARILSLRLDGTRLTVVEGEVERSVDLAALGDDADADATNELLQSAALNGTLLELVDAGGATRVDLAALVDDADADPANELISLGVLNGTVLELTEGDHTTFVDLADLMGGDPTDELVEDFSFDGSTLSLLEAGNTWDVDLSDLRVQDLFFDGRFLTLAQSDGELVVDLSDLINGLDVDDADADPSNELLQDVFFDGDQLNLVDNGNQWQVDLSDLREYIQDVSFDGNQLSISDDNNNWTVDLSDLREYIQDVSFDGNQLSISDDNNNWTVDLSDLREYIQDVSFDGNQLSISDNGNNWSVDLSDLREYIQDVSRNGDELFISDNNNNWSVDLSDLREYIQDVSFDGSTLFISDNNNNWSVDLSELREDDDADPQNELIQDVSFDGDTLTLSDEGNQWSVDLSELREDDDADPENELQTLSFEGNTGSLTLSDGNTVRVYDGAYVLSSNIGLSRDDIAFADTFTGDDVNRNVLLPFSVTYEGVAYGRIILSSNGWFELTNLEAAGATDRLNRCLPANNHPGPFVAAYWDDLTGTVSWATEGTAPNRVFNILWDSRTFTGSLQTVFSAQIHEGSGLIHVRYFNMNPAAIGNLATIGFQNAAGAKAYPLGCNARVLDDNSDDSDPSDQGWSISPLR